MIDHSKTHTIRCKCSPTVWCEIVSVKNKELADSNAMTSSKSFISFVKKHKIIDKAYGSDIKFEWKIEDGKS